jgi:hypothetical protein
MMNLYKNNGEKNNKITKRIENKKLKKKVGLGRPADPKQEPHAKPDSVPGSSPDDHRKFLIAQV